MKTLFFISALALSLAASAQNVSGFYTGTLFNDSTKMLQKYELALSDYRGKIDGYSYVTFVKNDTFYYGIRKVKGRIAGDSLIVTDDKMVSNNFPEPPAKGVGRTITIPLKGQDSLKIVSGSWKTNQTKKYYSVPGSIDLNRSTDSSSSPLISHLQELNLIATPNYYQNQSTQPLAASGPDPKENKTNAETRVASSGKKKKAEPSRKTEDEVASLPVSQPVQNSSEENITTTRKKEKEAETTAHADVKKGKPATAAAGSGQSNTQTAAANPVSKPEPAADREKSNTNEKDRTVQRTTGENPNNTMVKPVVADPTPAELPYIQRKNKIIQTIDVQSDSLVLAFYDNGVVDGDSVSVYLNDQSIAKDLRLTTTATKKTIPVRAGMDIRLLLVAENLGRLPPNTGLITIRDGDTMHQVHFSADMATNATILIRKKE